MQTLSTHRCHGGTLAYYAHASESTQCTMRLTIFHPQKPCGKALLYLSGLTCSEENFTTKAGAYRMANALGLTIVAPDTSPRGDAVPDDASIGLGKGAGFYVDATQPPWNTHYRMYRYCADELPSLVEAHFAIQRFGILGHSMGGHGALVIGLRNPQRFESISAFAPICHPSQDGWGPSAFTAYLGPDTTRWADYDACLLMRNSQGGYPTLRIDQGLSDAAYLEGRLNPEAFRDACAAVGQPLALHFHEGYDHGYFLCKALWMRICSIMPAASR